MEADMHMLVADEILRDVTSLLRFSIFVSFTDVISSWNRANIWMHNIEIIDRPKTHNQLSFGHSFCPSFQVSKMYKRMPDSWVHKLHMQVTLLEINACGAVKIQALSERVLAKALVRIPFKFYGTVKHKCIECTQIKKVAENCHVPSHWDKLHGVCINSFICNIHSTFCFIKTSDHFQ